MKRIITMPKHLIKTPRLGLRNWINSDLQPFAAMCADKRVMEFFPSIWNQEISDKFIKGMQNHYLEHGYCYFAVDRLDTQEFIGFIGLKNQDYETGFNPFVDIGWRLTPEAWGYGYATEGAKACLDFAFKKLSLAEVYAVTPELNKKSQNVMQKIGMNYHSTIEHPKVDKNNPLRKCVVFKIKTGI